MKRLVLLLTICLMAATAAEAQTGGGGGRRGGGGGKGGGRAPPTSPTTPPAQTGGPVRAPTAPDKVGIVGVITAIDTMNDRITIDCEASDALNLPAGTRPFAVAKHALMQDRMVGEKVRFTLESQQIETLSAF